jgi:hypothetical protein
MCFMYSVLGGGDQQGKATEMDPRWRSNLHKSDRYGAFQLQVMGFAVYALVILVGLDHCLGLVAVSAFVLMVYSQ